MKSKTDPQACPDCEETSASDPSRREFLRKLAGGAAAVTLLGAIGSCTEDLPEMLVGEVQAMRANGTLSPKFNGNRIMAIEKEGKIVIFSLVCRHKACTVKWKDDKDRFECPCHEGTYDSEGEVISGPPPGPLRRYKHEIRGQDLWVLNSFED
jgi:nitrite reductase/ring-hydroxylating ferredoxin subunit